MRPLALILATAGGVGFLPVAPGTWGSAAAVALVWAWAALGGGMLLYLTVTAVVTVAGVWAAGVAEHAFDREDDGRIVVDEVAGQLVTLLPVALWLRGDAFFAGLVTGFVLFRGLDIAKPGPVRRAERVLPGGLGVMADDVVAGLLGAAVLTGLLVLLGSGLAPGLSGWLEGSR